MKIGRSLNQSKPAQKHRMFSVCSRQFSKHSLEAYFRQKDQALIENRTILSWFWAPFSQHAVGTRGPDKLYLIAHEFFWLHLELGFLDWKYLGCPVTKLCIIHKNNSRTHCFIETCCSNNFLPCRWLAKAALFSLPLSWEETNNKTKLQGVMIGHQD